MPDISEKTLEWAKAHYEDEVQNFLDDPDGYLGGDSAWGAIEYLNLIGRDLGTHFWETVLEGFKEDQITQFEIDRLEEILRKERAK